MGKQKLEDTGPLNIERMKTVDEELIQASEDFIKRAHGVTVRVGNWKLQFPTSENYYAPWVTQKFPIVHKRHFDPYESFDNITHRSDIIQRKQWLSEPVRELIAEHVKTLQEHPACRMRRRSTFRRSSSR